MDKAEFIPVVSRSILIWVSLDERERGILRDWILQKEGFEDNNGV